MKKIPASLQKMRYDKQGEIVQVVCLVDSVTKGSDCTKCYFFDMGASCSVFTSEMVGPCSAVQRDDREHVFFERVGEVCDNSEEDS